MQISRLELDRFFDLREVTEQAAENCTVGVRGEKL